MWVMTPQTVNAVNMPAMNALNFPAAILQPPFFDAARADAMNYGGIGAVIGHEISHSFDNLGRRVRLAWADAELVDARRTSRTSRRRRTRSRCSTTRIIRSPTSRSTGSRH